MMRLELHYATKTLLSILSGFRGLEVARQDPDDWNKKYYDPLEDGDNFDDPYYVCAAFNNGRHIPLPIVLRGMSGYKMQDRILRLFWQSKSLRDARAACQRYVDQFEDGIAYWVPPGASEEFVAEVQ